MAAGTVAGYEVNGRPVRLIRSEDPDRVRIIEDWPAVDVELVVEDVPPLGYRRIELVPSEAHDDVVDDGRTIGDETGLQVEVATDGTLTVRRGELVLSGLCGVEDLGDRGDSYDFDPVDDDPGALIRSLDIERRRHPSGIERLVITRTFELPARVRPERDRRSDDTVELTVRTEVRLVSGVDRVDLHVTTDNPAEDHRLRLLFPTGVPTESFVAATTFDAGIRPTAPQDAEGWWHPAPDTFPHQGWIAANGLVVGAPGLPEAEVTAEGTIVLTLLRAVGWLSHIELGRRPIAAGPAMPAPGAQCPDGISADITLRLFDPSTPLDVGRVSADAIADELGLRAVPAGPDPIVAEGAEILRVAPEGLVLSALKPAEDGDGVVLRLLNPSGQEIAATVDFGLPIVAAESVRLDEHPDGRGAELEGDRVRLDLGPHALRSIRMRIRG